MSTPVKPAPAELKKYDEAYFRKWYREPRTRVHPPLHIRRKVRMVLAITEYFLSREIRTVLDIGAGEGAWRAELKRVRPGVTYEGLDPSEYVVRRYGKRRNIRQATFGDLPALRLRSSYDLIVCADAIQYVNEQDLRAGLKTIGRVLGGLAYLESYTTGDDMEGDLSGWHRRTAKEYLESYRSAGLYSCGLHCFLSRRLADKAVELELR